MLLFLILSVKNYLLIVNMVFVKVGQFETNLIYSYNIIIKLLETGGHCPTWQGNSNW